LFFSAIYTESLFLLVSIGACYHFQRGEFTRSSLWGVLAGLTRPNGCFLALPLAILALTPRLGRWLAGDTLVVRPPRNGDVGATWRTVMAVLAPGIGVLIYSAFIWQLTGHPLAWARGQMAWGREYNGLAVLVQQRYEWLSQGGLYEYTKNVPADLLNAASALFVIGAAWPVARRLGVAYAVLILINMLPPLAAGGFLSAGRLSSVMFPAFVWLGRALSPRHRPAWIASFMAVQAFNAALFYTWRPLY
jgi:hypothetical protein